MRYRIRSLKPELFRDEKVQRLPVSARLLYVGLISHADDEGRLDGDTRIIRSLIFPMDDLALKHVDRLLDQVASIGLIHRYGHDGFDWIEIRGWAKHQSVNRPTASRIPSYASQNGRADEEPEP
jgi:hypothetical protein